MDYKLEDFLDEILITEDKIKNKIKELANQINKDYYDISKKNEIILLGILKGASFFLSDLMREIKFKHKIDFMAISSYGNSTITSGIVKILKDLDEDIKDKYILIVEDIIDTGLTMRYLIDFLKQKKPKDIKICVLLDKPARRKVNIKANYTGFTIEDKFVIGYGLDFNEEFRQLPYIAILNYKNYIKIKKQ